MKRQALLLALLFFQIQPAAAVEPDEILHNATLEARARAISAGLRCLVCQNQSIDDSEAPVAKDLRILIRDQLQQQKSDAEVVDFIVARYGDYVLLKPRLTASTALLWALPFLILLGGAALAFRRNQVTAPERLSESEMAEVAAILRK